MKEAQNANESFYAITMEMSMMSENHRCVQNWEE